MVLIIRTSRILNDQVVLIILSFFLGFFATSDPKIVRFWSVSPLISTKKAQFFFACGGLGGLIILSLRILSDRVVLIIRTSPILNGPGGSY